MIVLPPRLEVLSFTPDATLLFLEPPPANLRVIILKGTSISSCDFRRKFLAFISKCTSVNALAVEEYGAFSFFYLSGRVLILRLDPGSTELFKLLPLIGPQFKNVCYRLRGWSSALEDVEKVWEYLTHSPCTFKSFSFLLPTMNDKPTQIPIWQQRVISFTHRFELDACFFQIEGLECLYGSPSESNKYIIEGWNQVLDKGSYYVA